MFCLSFGAFVSILLLLICIYLLHSRTTTADKEQGKQKEQNSIADSKAGNHHEHPRKYTYYNEISCSLSSSRNLFSDRRKKKKRRKRRQNDAAKQINVPDEVEMEMEDCRVVKNKVIEDMNVDKENDALEMILKLCEEVCGKVLDFTDLAGQDSYNMEWNNVEMETDEVVAQIYCEDEMEWSDVKMGTEVVAQIYCEDEMEWSDMEVGTEVVAQIYCEDEMEWSDMEMGTEVVAQIYCEDEMEWSDMEMGTEVVAQIYCEEVKGKVTEDEKENDELEVGQHCCVKEVREVIDIIHLSEEVLDYEWSEEKEKDELQVRQHYCGKEAREVINVRNMSGVKRKRKTMNRKRDSSTVEALKAK